MPTRRIDSHQDVPLGGDWSLAWTAPGAAGDPATMAALPLAWLPAVVPGTVASARAASAVNGSPGMPDRLDGVDWWYRCRFPVSAVTAGARMVLCFDGLATVASVWLNGESVLRSENMFVAHEVEVANRLRPEGDNEIVLCFRALDSLLAAKRPRPRWRAPMVEHQQLRWFRTTLLGRTPGWSPALPAVGPWRSIRLERRTVLDVQRADVRSTVEGRDGVLTVALTLQSLVGQPITAARLVVSGPNGGSWEAALVSAPESPTKGVLNVTGTVRIPDVAVWWPHTHGDQPLYDLRVVVALDGQDRTVEMGHVGFRSVAVATADGDFAVSINGVPIFCRGACWTPLDVATLSGSTDEYRQTLQAVRDAGMNMVRVGGPMVYETDVFYDTCDQQGILVWQDFMFANMDYPEEAGFVAGVQAEARQVLTRWQARPSLTVLCGDSEGEQQAAMWGAPPANWNRPLFREVLPALCRDLCPDVPYWPSSASGGAFPHQPSVGSTSYYGVGAYLRPLDDARRSDVRFASECLAFANVPEEPVLATLAGGGPVRVHTPAWKAGVPRDLGAGWDFDDVRDHYLGVLYGVDPVTLRSTDPDRYLALGRITTGEVMETAFAEWRRGRSPCRGALIWFLRDLVAGAGWGILDVSGRPKAAYHYLRRVLQPVAVFFSNEGLNGSFVHAVNERATPWQGELRLRLYRDGEIQVGAGDTPAKIPNRGGLELSAAALLGGFSDTTYAYHFGPPEHDLAVATLVSGSGAVESEAFFFPVGRPVTREGDLGMEATVQQISGGDFALTVRSRRFAYAVVVNVGGFDCQDNYFHVAPGSTKRIVLRRAGAAGEPRGSVQAVNARAATKIVATP